MRYSRRKVLGAGLGLATVGALRARAARAAELSTNPFTLGIASGYPEPNAVVLWTRLAPEPLAPGGGMPNAPVAVEWEIAEDDAFRKIRRKGTAYATPDWAHSVHVEATGLEPARDYWYRFTSGGARSPVGRTRTAPAAGAAVAELKLAVASCQYYEWGYYAAYRAIAEDAPDLVVHVGDYIYDQRGVER
ncbi:MAG TPA: PhoD-like phosphatase N-terminal domain-containing protein, partial [Gammaproteobacteria bacterium]|nr:PhoD-like phosphatase N-terminal domain-containing protein [Gammaproteobacteria bacterium]